MLTLTLYRYMTNACVTHASKIFIQQLHISVDDLQCDEFVILILYSTAEIQACVSETQGGKIKISVRLRSQSYVNISAFA